LRLEPGGGLAVSEATPRIDDSITPESAASRPSDMIPAAIVPPISTNTAIDFQDIRVIVESSLLAIAATFAGTSPAGAAAESTPA
jgi:hypothetical protein